MITLYSRDFTTKYGAISSLCEAFVEEERNGLFELSFIMLNTDSLFNYVKEENIVVVNANDTLLNQKFRIYMTRKLMNNRVEVYARHISFDLMYDYIDNVSFENQSCEYALNQLFRNSNFSKHYKGYSDIINAQDYSMSMANVLEAIGGKQGSIIDTFGTGAEILRDNENIHILNKRGHDNGVTIEYRKNLTGFELEEDTTDLVTKILPYAKYNDIETNEEIIVKADYVDSPLIANYSHPYISSIDYSEKLKEGEIPTIEKLVTLARNEYKNNKVDIPKQNFKIEFIPLSKCVGCEGLEDKISLCDTVTIKDTRYNVNTQAKVIKTVFNVLKNRYESMELGEPKTSLGDIVGSGSNEGVVGPPGPQGPPGADGNIGDFPNSLPSTPVVTTKVYGFANIEISWTFENKVYYQYEVYASKEANFTPNTFNLIHQGQTSTFMYQAKPNETWYFKVCAINTHGERTSFGSAYATTIKIDDLSNYVENIAINDALIGTLNLGRGWIGTLRGNYIDARQLSVTDGNGKRTMDIDSFGNVSLDVSSFKLKAKDVATENYTNNLVDNAKNEAINNSKTYTDAQINLVNGEITLKASKTEVINAKNEAINSSNNSTDTKLKKYSTTTEMQSAIKVASDAINLEVGKKVDGVEVKTIIQQSPNDIKIGFNSINDSVLIDQNKMQFKDTLGNQSLSFMRGSLYAYEPNTSVFMGAGLIPRWNEGIYNAGFGILASANSYYYSISKANSWEADAQANPGSIDEYFIINYRDRGSDLSQKQGCHTYYKLYTSGGINGMGYDIENFTNIKCLDLYAGTIRDTSGSTVLTTNGSSVASNKNWNFNYYTLSNVHLSNASLNTSQDCSVGSISTYTYKGSNGTTLFTSASTCSNRVGWAWNNNNLLDPVIIGGSYGYSITPNTDTYSNVKTCNGDVNLDGILDKINIYPAQSTYKTNSERSLEIDVTELRESENADMFIKRHDTVNSETGESEIVENIDMKSMLHLALLEIKKLKEEIQDIKGGIVDA